MCTVSTVFKYNINILPVHSDSNTVYTVFSTVTAGDPDWKLAQNTNLVSCALLYRFKGRGGVEPERKRPHRPVDG